MTFSARIALALLAVIAAAAALPAVAASPAGSWVAFVAPDIEQSRKLHADLVRLTVADLGRRGIALEFVPVADSLDGSARQALQAVVARRPVAILAASGSLAMAARDATRDIPVIFASVADPVRIGLVESLAAPGGNLTGFTYDVPIEEKQFEILSELAPRARVIGVIEDGHWLGTKFSGRRLQEREKALGVEIRVFVEARANRMARIPASTAARGVDAWFIPISDGAALGRAGLVEAIRRTRKPAVYGRTLFVEAGGLASYQEVIPSPMELWRDSLHLVLAGTPPARIPVQRPKDFELALNLDEAARSGLAIPPSFLRRANRIVYLGQ